MLTVGQLLGGVCETETQLIHPFIHLEDRHLVRTLEVIDPRLDADLLEPKLAEHDRFERGVWQRHWMHCGPCNHTLRSLCKTTNMYYIEWLTMWWPVFGCLHHSCSTRDT